jgi:uncharacterized phage protein gp47/JayE
VTIENGELTVKTADVWEADYQRFARMRNPNAKTGPDEYYNVQSKNLASVLVSLSNDARVIAGKISLQDRTGKQLDEVGKPVSEGGLGIPRPGAVGSSGSVTIQATLSGCDIEAGDECAGANGVAYACTTTAHYSDGDAVPIICTETGPQTDLAAGSKLSWSNSRPGRFPGVTVYAQPNGSGLTGGREELGDDDYRMILAEAIVNPASAANDAYLQRLAMDSRAHGIAVEKCFTYPCVLGPGTNAFAITLRGSTRNTSRIPNPTQLNAVAGYVAQWLPASDGLIKLPLVDDPLTLSFRVTWATNGWVDFSPWPAYGADGLRVVVISMTSSSVFNIGYVDGVVAGRVAPQPGQSIAMFNPATGKVVRKTILSVSVGVSNYGITCNTLTNLTDLGYVPVANQWVMPWSPSLQGVLDLSISYVNAMGPGEVVARFLLPQDGMRIARNPADAPLNWPSQMDSHLLGAVTSLSTIKNATHIDGADFAGTTGGPEFVYLPRLTDFAVYAL